MHTMVPCVRTPNAAYWDYGQFESTLKSSSGTIVKWNQLYGRTLDRLGNLSKVLRTILWIVDFIDLTVHLNVYKYDLAASARYKCQYFTAWNPACIHSHIAINHLCHIMGRKKIWPILAINHTVQYSILHIALAFILIYTEKNILLCIHNTYVYAYMSALVYINRLVSTSEPKMILFCNKGSKIVAHKFRLLCIYLREFANSLDKYNGILYQAPC